MPGYHTTRRTALRVIGGTLAVGALASPASAGNGSDDFSRELNSVRTATRKYRDVSEARDDDYDTIVSPYVPQMGFHFVNPDLLAPDEDTAVDITEPPILVYFPNESYNPSPGDPHDPENDDDLILGAVEYGHLGTAGADADYFSDEEANRRLKVTEAEGWHPPHPPDVPFTALHAWVHRGNPAGVFHPENPTID